MKLKCLEKHRAKQREHELEKKREYQERYSKRSSSLNHFPTGSEDEKEYKYHEDLRPSIKRAKNPHGYMCKNPRCGKIIVWTWRNGELWNAPRYYCSEDLCQRNRMIKADHSPSETYSIITPKNPSISANP